MTDTRRGAPPRPFAGARPGGRSPRSGIRRSAWRFPAAIISLILGRKSRNSIRFRQEMAWQEPCVGDQRRHYGACHYGRNKRRVLRLIDEAVRQAEER